MNYLIRDCEPKDLPELVQLCALHAAYEKADYSAEGKQDRLHEALFGEKKVLNCWVVEINHQLAGYCSFTFDYSTWNAAYFLYMDCLFLTEECRGYGIGEAIIQKLQQVAKEKGNLIIQWQTPAFNERAIKFYRRMGAREKEKVRFYL